jgi:uncharacterized membrane protein YbhN (UPF0104 family)
MTRQRVVTILLGAAVLVGIALTVGAEPFVRGLAAVSPTAVAAAALLGAASTLAAAWRWRAVAHGLGLRLGLVDAVAAYYRSQLLNSVLPGGVVGDVHRAYRHGREVGEVALSARAVATERIAGQTVQLVTMAIVLVSLGLTSSLSGMAWIAGAAALVLVTGLAIAATTPRGRRALRREGTALRRVFADPRRAAVVVVSSLVVVACLVATFVIACLAVGVDAGPRDLIALALITLVAAALPINIGGWGPREAAAGSAFAVIGLGVSAGVAASTTFGVLTLIAVAPGLLVLLLDRRAGGPAPVPVPTPASRHVTETTA